jgi:hypothetical protein
VLEFVIGLDGSGRLFCACAAAEPEGRLLVYEDLVAGLTTRFLAVLGSLYAAGGYLGSVDVGLAVKGLEGGVSAYLQEHRTLRRHPQPYDRDEYRRTERFSALALKVDPRSAARRISLPLFRVITQGT